MGSLTAAERLALAREKGLIEADPPALRDTLEGIETVGVHRSPADDDIDRVIGSVDIATMYSRWCGKSVPNINGKRESIMVSCPTPEHKDGNPSAWLNLDKGTWFCGGCQRGGDGYDIAAWHFGHPVPGYKQGAAFGALRKQMAESFGWVESRSPSGERYLERVGSGLETTPEPPANHVENPDENRETPDQEPTKPVQSSGGAGETDVASPVRLVPDPDNLDDPSESLPIDWRSIVPEDTFLDQWMKTMSVDDLPEEYYFWLGLMAIGLAAGNEAILADTPNVKSNLFVCLYGDTGIGKTRSVSFLMKLLHKALPYDENDYTSTGAALVAVPGSAEALIDSFSKPIPDPNDPKVVAAYGAVRGLVRFDELSNLMGRSNRVGSVIKPTLMEMYDSYDAIEIKSRGAGRVRAENHFVNAITTVQPKAIKDLLLQSDADSGFCNRWVFATGVPKQLISYRPTGIDIGPLVQPLQQLRQWTSTHKRRITLEGGALDVWNQFFDAVIEPIRNARRHGNKEDEPLLTRVDLLMKKLILLFCINENVDKPSPGLVESVIELFPYVERSYNMVIGQISLGPMSECRDEMIKIIERLEKKTGKPVKMREVKRRLKNQFEPDLIVKTLEVMRRLGDLDECQTQGAAGPISFGYRLAKDA